jgi:Fe-S oxidoreductase
MLEKCDFEEIFTTDPHTFNTLKNEYPDKGGNYPVKHYSTLLLELIQSGDIALKKKLDIKATYMTLAIWVAITAFMMIPGM